MGADLAVRDLGVADYGECHRAMRAFTESRGRHTPDELWLLEHPPVYTLGQAGNPRGLRRRGGGIPLVQSDRGGQITYHGPGQAVAYLLLDLRRLGCGPRRIVACMEEAAVALLAQRGVAACADPRRPGVYVGGKKIAAVGLRVRRGCCYHGISLNVDMDLSPFGDIDPCGYPGLEMCQLRDFPGAHVGAGDAKALLGAALQDRIGALARGAILAADANG